jgi:hypothetical protein
MAEKKPGPLVSTNFACSGALQPLATTSGKKAAAVCKLWPKQGQQQREEEPKQNEGKRYYKS